MSEVWRNLPEEWTRSRIRDHLTSYRGGAPLSPSDFVNEGVKVLPKKGVGFSGVLRIPADEQSYADFSFAMKHARSVFSGAHWLATTLRDLVPTGPSIGLVVSVPNDTYLLAQGVYAFELKSSLDSKFLVYLSQTPQYRQIMRSIMVGSTQVHVRTDDFFEVPIPLPPVGQQRKVAQILTTLDDLIEKTEALIAKYQVIKQGLMHDLFTRGVDEHGHLRPTYEEAPELYKESELGWIPKEWKVKPVKRLAAVRYGISDPLDRTVEDGVPIIALPNVNINGELVLDSVPRIEHRKVKPGDLLKEGELLFNWRNGSREHLGKTAYFNLPGNWTHVGFLLRVSANPEVCTRRYLFYEFTYRRSIGYFLTSKSQVNNTFNSSELEEMLIRIPGSLEEQERIAERLSSLYQKIYGETNYLKTLWTLKTGLMQDLLTGEVEVTLDEED